MKNITMTIIAILVLLGIGKMIMIGADKQEKKECIDWWRQSQMYENYYIMRWQDEQCRAHDIIIRSRVI